MVSLDHLCCHKWSPWTVYAQTIYVVTGPFCATLKTQSNGFILLDNESVFMYRHKLLAYFIPRYAPSIIYGIGDSLFEFTCSQGEVTPRSSVIPPATAVKNKVKGQEAKIVEVKGHTEGVKSQRLLRQYSLQDYT